MSFSRFESYERALFARQIVVTALPAAVFLLPDRGAPGAALLYLAGAATVHNFVYYLLHMKGWMRNSLPWSRLAFDVMLWTALLALTGGPASFFYIGYLVEILISAIAISSAGCLVAGIVSTIAYGIMLAAQPGVLALEQGLSRAAALLLTGATAFVLIRRVERRREQAEALNRRLTRRLTDVQSQIDEMRSRLARAETLSRIGETASGMAHEMVNSVHGLRGFLSLLRDELRAEPRHARLITMIETGLRGLDEIGREVMSRVRAADEPEETVDVCDLLDEAAALAGAESARVETRVIGGRSPRPIVVRACRGALRRAFVNLFRNSLQAMPEGGRLTIRIVPQEAGRVAIEIADTGAGIPAPVRDRLFEPFVTGRAGGNGLGLALSRNAIGRCGGEIEVSRTGPEGTVMTVVLPLDRAVEPRDVESPDDGELLLQRG